MLLTYWKTKGTFNCWEFILDSCCVLETNETGGQTRSKESRDNNSLILVKNKRFMGYFSLSWDKWRQTSWYVNSKISFEKLWDLYFIKLTVGLKNRNLRLPVIPRKQFGYSVVESDNNWYCFHLSFIFRIFDSIQGVAVNSILGRFDHRINPYLNNFHSRAFKFILYFF